MMMPRCHRAAMLATAMVFACVRPAAAQQFEADAPLAAEAKPHPYLAPDAVRWEFLSDRRPRPAAPTIPGI